MLKLSYALNFTIFAKINIKKYEQNQIKIK